MLASYRSATISDGVLAILSTNSLRFLDNNNAFVARDCDRNHDLGGHDASSELRSLE